MSFPQNLRVFILKVGLIGFNGSADYLDGLLLPAHLCDGGGFMLKGFIDAEKVLHLVEDMVGQRAYRPLLPEKNWVMSRKSPCVKA